MNKQESKTKTIHHNRIPGGRRYIHIIMQGKREDREGNPDESTVLFRTPEELSNIGTGNGTPGSLLVLKDRQTGDGKVYKRLELRGLKASP